MKTEIEFLEYLKEVIDRDIDAEAKKLKLRILVSTRLQLLELERPCRCSKTMYTDDEIDNKRCDPDGEVGGCGGKI